MTNALRERGRQAELVHGRADQSLPLRRRDPARIGPANVDEAVIVPRDPEDVVRDPLEQCSAAFLTRPQRVLLVDAHGEIEARDQVALLVALVGDRRDRPFGDELTGGAGHARLDRRRIGLAPRGEEPPAHAVRLRGEREELPPIAAARGGVVDDSGGRDKGVVEADDPSVLVGDDEVARRRVDDVTDEVALTLELVEAREQLGLEAIALDRQARGGDERLDELRLLEQGRVVHECADRAVAVVDRRHGPGRIVVRQVVRSAVDVDVAAALGEPEHQLERRIAERAAQALLRLRPRGVAATSRRAASRRRPGPAACA